MSDVVAVPPARRLIGGLAVPSDKSITHRALLLGLLAEGTTVIDRPLLSEDCEATRKACEMLGANIRAGTRPAPTWIVDSPGIRGIRPPADPIDCANSGTTMRLIAGILAGLDGQATLQGDKSLTRRPMDRVAGPLMQMGADVTVRQKRYPPMTIRGTRNLKPISYVPPAASAQVKSCVLLAGLFASGETAVREPVPTRDHTERMLPWFGVPLYRRGGAVRVWGPARPRPATVSVPGDISAAAFLLAAAAGLGGSELQLRGVGVNPTRTGLLDVLERMGVPVRIESLRVESAEPRADLILQTPKSGLRLRGIEIGGDLIPRLVDELPAIAALATQAEGDTVIRDAAELRVKESDRIAALAEGLTAMGARVESRPDGLVIHGPTRLKGSRVASHGDHRIAMALAAAACWAEGPTLIEGAECVSISFPGFFEALGRCAA